MQDIYPQMGLNLEAENHWSTGHMGLSSFLLFYNLFHFVKKFAKIYELYQSSALSCYSRMNLLQCDSSVALYSVFPSTHSYYCCGCLLK